MKPGDDPKKALRASGSEPPARARVPASPRRKRLDSGLDDHPAIAGKEDAVDAIVRGDWGDPFSVLGPHHDAPNGATTLRLFLPDARSVTVIDANTRDVICGLDEVHPSGFWAAILPPDRALGHYLYRADMPAGVWEFEDAYRFPPILGEMDIHFLVEGSHFKNYERLGAHAMTMDGVDGVAFCVWAPNARRVSVVGEFCAWDGRRLPMRMRHECGVWEVFVPHVRRGAFYKYEIRGPKGELLPLKADPYGLYAERPPHTASITYDLNDIRWNDDAWLAHRSSANSREAPISIYEVHLGSWRRVPEDRDRYLTYTELADQLIPYAKDMGFTHLELMPINEHPFDGSWGYQPVGLYAPTSRHGRPEEFAAFVDRCHREGLGVLIDWVPGHFPTDPHGLGSFDGTHLFEHADPRQGFQQDWNTLIYNYGRREVMNFLLGNALFWLDHYHIDGLRVDAVASMLYLDYSRQPGQWVPNAYGGNENLEAVAFLKRLNELLFGQYPGATSVAEESTAWPGVSKPTFLGGLGFGFKWNMGWMHDTLHYISEDPIHRRWHHHELSFGLLYAFSENFILPLSHDEVVHGKRSLIGRMPGDQWQRFANLRSYYGFMFGHPGKKLLFMGCEIAQEREWSHQRSLDWHLLENPLHKGVQNLLRDLNRVYREIPALHQLDCESDGFEWLVADDAENSVIAFLRRGRDPNQMALVVCNFTPVPRHDYRIGVPSPGGWRERINTDSSVYGGSNLGNGGFVQAEPVPSHSRTHSVRILAPPLATVIFTFEPS
jgi:1,4-alpha-glucan branching enzyme